MQRKRWLLLGVCAAVAGVASFLVYDGRILFGRNSDSDIRRDVTRIRDPHAAGSKVDSAGGDAGNGATGSSTGSEGDALPDADRKYVWDIEHVALILDVHVFPRIGKAIREADAAALAAFLNDDFQSRLIEDESHESARYPFADFRWLGDPKDAAPQANKEEFVAYLLRQRSLFIKPTKADVRLMRLSPVKRGEMDGTWQGTMKIRIAGERTDGRPAEIELNGQFTLENPRDEILEQSGWLRSFRIYSWRNFDATNQLMRDVAAERGIDPKRFHDNWDHPDTPPMVVQGGVYLCDYDRDGRLDVLITDMNGLAFFHGNGDGYFTETTESSGLAGAVKRQAAPAIFADFDGDAYEDLIIADQIFRNNQDGTFSDMTAITNLRLPQSQGAYAVADYDLDGQLDLYVVRASPGPVGRSRVSWVDDQSGPGNQLWKNLGNWRFRNVTETANASAGHRSCFAAVWLDANSDGRPDIAASDEFGSSVLLVNQLDGRFNEQVLKPPFGGFCMGIAAGDFDNDGHVDLYLANMFSKAGDRIIANLPPDAYNPDLRAKIQEFVVGSELLRGNGDGRFTALGRAMNVNGVGWAYGPNFVDLDNDGWLDIYAPAGFLSYTRGEPDG
jgi:hypothetical protein